MCTYIAACVPVNLYTYIYMYIYIYIYLYMHIRIWLCIRLLPQVFSTPLFYRIQRPICIINMTHSSVDALTSRVT